MSELQNYLTLHLGDLVNNDFKSFGREIKRTRVESKIRQNDLAKKTGLSQSCLSSIEQGKYNLSVKQLVRIADGLNCKIIFKLEKKNG